MNYSNDNARTSTRSLLDLCESDKEWKMICEELKEAIDPLTSEQEREAFSEMIVAAANGQNDKRSSKRELIFKANIRLACNVAKDIVNKRRICYGEYASSVLDLMHVAYRAIYRAIDLFNVDSGWRFSTYACKAIWREINMEDGIKKRYEKCIGPMKRLDEEIDPSGDTQWRDLLADTRSTPIFDRICRREEVSKLKVCMRKLSDCERDCLSTKYKMTRIDTRLADVAAKYGISSPRVSQITTEALAKLRKLMAA